MPVSDHPELDRHREEARRLMNQQDQLMRQLQGMETELQTHGVGMDEPLLDREGYPRSDIDVAAVRTLRHRIICLRNDHKQVMQEIEAVLHHIHQQAQSASSRAQQQPLASTSASNDTTTTTTTTSSTPSEPMDTEDAPLQVPFAKVNAVSPDSPASAAGLARNDLIVQFGSLRADHMRPLSSLTTIVQASMDQPLPVVVLRNNEPLHLTLIPSTNWGGRGALGCHIVPL
ncbi:hypothetical protein BC940DRAFT_311868 [Gongronella butleri]|nr:hypothetical protein BC940DRAFT_311868 [Gongronella butleri]